MNYDNEFRGYRVGVSNNKTKQVFLKQVCSKQITAKFQETMSMACSYVYLYAFSRRFYPKRLTNEDITSYIKKLTIN